MVLLALTMKSTGEEFGQNQNKNLTRHILHKMSKRLVRQYHLAGNHTRGAYILSTPSTAKADKNKAKNPPLNARKPNQTTLLLTANPRTRWVDIKRLKLSVSATGTRERNIKLLFNKGLGFWKPAGDLSAELQSLCSENQFWNLKEWFGKGTINYCCRAEGSFIQQI